MDDVFLVFLGLALLAAPFLLFFVLMSKINDINYTLNSISFEISTLKSIMEKMQREKESKPNSPIETKQEEIATQPKEQPEEAPKEETRPTIVQNTNWWEEEIKNEIETKEKTEEPVITHDSEQLEEQETPETVEIPVVNNENVRPSTVEIPVKDTKEEEASETTEENPETTEEPVEEPKEEPAMAMEENSSMREEESSMLEEEPQTEEYTIRESNFEKYIGENLFGKIGILIFIIGIGFFVKYAIDQNWINETARTLMGYAVGVGMLVLAERLHKRYHAFSSLLAGGAFGIFYLITAIAFHYYALFSHTTAFVILCATTLFMSAVSILYDRVELAVTALVGGFIAPFIISTNASSIISLQIYISILNVGMFCLTMYKRWAILPIISFCFTYCILWGTQAITYISSSETGTIYPTLFAFATLFYFIFLLPVVYILRTQCEGKTRTGLLSIVTINSFLYLLYGNYILQQYESTNDATAYLAFFIAAVNLAIYLYVRFRVEGQDTLRNLMLGLGITFASIAIPLYFSTANIAMVWAAEAVLLLWLFTKEKNLLYEWGATILLLLTLVVLACYRESDVFIHDAGRSLFFNGSFFVTMFVSVAFFVTAIILQCNKELFKENNRILSYTPCNVIAWALGFSILYLAFWDDFHLHLAYPASDYASLLTANVLILVGALILRKRFEISKYPVAYEISIYITGIIFAIAVWNSAVPDQLTYRWLITLVTIAYMIYSMRGVLLATSKRGNLYTEYAIISTLVWLTTTRLLLVTFGETGFSTAFSLSLGVAAFILMCIGMRYHSKEIRIVSLCEFAIIIGKLVLNDVWAMPALGKIIVFISLGAILLILSFLYQKLKDALFNEDEKEQE